MAGLPHTRKQERLPDTKLEWLFLPAIWTSGQKDQAQIEESSLIIGEGDPLPPSRRLVVILPDAPFDGMSLPKRIWNLAAPDHRQVLLLTRPYQEENEFYSRRNLTSLAALIRDPRIKVETHMVLGISLEQAALQYAQPDDIFVCFKEHHVSRFLRRRRLAEVLVGKTGLPVYTLNGPVHEMSDSITARLIDFLLLVLCIATIIAFFGLGIWIDHNTFGTFHTVIQILAAVAEVWMIGALATKFRI